MQLRTRIKICGITRPQDAMDAAMLGADAIGLVFCTHSLRAVTVAHAVDILAALPPLVARVGLFMDNSAAEVRTAQKSLPLTLLQFHGQESPEFCEQFKYPYIKAIPMLASIDIRAYAQSYRHAQAYLLDATDIGEAGGCGQRFDWKMIPDDLGRPVIVAGGLHQDNVAVLVKSGHCYAVDVSSGVESAKGIKDTKKMKDFMQQVRMADNERLKR